MTDTTMTDITTNLSKPVFNLDAPSNESVQRAIASADEASTKHAEHVARITQINADQMHMRLIQQQRMRDWIQSQQGQNQPTNMISNFGNTINYWHLPGHGSETAAYNREQMRSRHLEFDPTVRMNRERREQQAQFATVAKQQDWLESDDESQGLLTVHNIDRTHNTNFHTINHYYDDDGNSNGNSDGESNDDVAMGALARRMGEYQECMRRYTESMRNPSDAA